LSNSSNTLFSGANPQLLPVEFFAERFFVVKIQRAIIATVTAFATSPTQVNNRVFLSLDPPIHLAFAKASFAIGLSSANTFTVKISES